MFVSIKTDKYKEISMQEKFVTRQPKIIGEGKLRHYSVLAPIIDAPEGSYLLFEKRSDKLNRQPGEICFPGGKLEPEESFEECAIRETMEELLIERNQIQILGPGDIFVSPFNIIVHPYIGSIKQYKDTYSLDEVADVIKVPLDYFQDNQPDQYGSIISNQLADNFPYDWIPGGENYPWAKGNYDILFYRYGEHMIWGMTAHIVRSVMELIEEYKIR